MFVAILVATMAMSEVYCRWSSRFSDFSFYYIKLIKNVDATQSVLGDSHVGWTDHMPGYAFLGQPGQQPEELLLLVHYLYDRLPPRRVILEASPQWFGWYHWDRKPLITPGALPPKILGFQPLILSEVFSRALFDNVVEDAVAFASTIIPGAHAEAPKPSDQEVNQVVNEWLTARGDLGRSFIWSTFPADKRQILTTGRVYDQNPVKDFRASKAAVAYQKAIEFLLERGAKVCLFRTPVTADYVATTKLIADSRYDEFDRYVKELSQSLSVRSVDFRELPFEFDDSKFFNQDHLNDQAATIVWPLVAKFCFGDG
jgi:hypothetical protein